MERLQSEIESFLRTGQGDFETLALELFAYQFELNKPYQAYCRAQEATPASVKSWQDIPAVPIGAFKSAELATFPIGQAAAVFESSGTTRQTPSRHYLKTLRYYEASLKASFAKWVLDVTPAEAGVHHGIMDSVPEQGTYPSYDQERKGYGFRRNDVMKKWPFLILAPSPAEAPRSSLTWMMDVVKRERGGPGSDYFIQKGLLEEPRLVRALRNLQDAGRPAPLLGTTLAFLKFFDYCEKQKMRFNLPPNSRLMDTGGMKTQKREISRPDFVRRAGEILGIPEDQCINEYGMCEMSSQFYGRGASSALQGPPWTRTLVIDPFTGQRAAAGQSGLLRHFDLANVDSVAAIQTEDVGRIEAEGFVLLGRAPGAEPKGCSLSVEMFSSHSGASRPQQGTVPSYEIKGEGRNPS